MEKDSDGGVWDDGSEVGGARSGSARGARGWSRWRAAPGPVAAVCALVTAEGIAMIVLAAFLAVQTVASTTESVGGAAALAAFVLVTGAGLVFCARGLLQRQRWGRAPTAVGQLCALPVALSLLGAGQVAAGSALLAVTGATLVLLFTPTVVRETTE